MKSGHWVLALGLGLTGCGPWIDEVVKERGAKVEQKLTLVRAVAEELPKTPLLEKNEPASVTATVSFEWPPSKPLNAAIAYAEDFRDLDELGLVYARVGGSTLVNQCSAYVHTEREPWDPLHPEATPASGTGYSAEKRFDACEKLDYLFVLRTRAFSKPSVGRTTSNPVKPEFDGGFVDVDVLVFDLAQKKRVAGLRVQAESSEKLEEAQAFNVEFDLQYNLQKALAAALKSELGVTVLGM